MKLKLIINSIGFLLLLLIIQYCVPSKPVQEERVVSSSRLIKKIEANRRKIKTFYGTGVLNVNTVKLEAKASFEILLKKPDTVKVSIFGPFGIDIAQAIVTKTSFEFFDVLNNKLYKGSNNDGIIKQILKVDLSFTDLMDAFSGAVNLSDKLSKVPDEFYITEDKYILTYNAKTLSNIYTVNIEDLALTEYKVLSTTQDILFEGQYKDFELFNTVPVPYSTQLLDKTNDQKITIDYRTIDVNKSYTNINLDLPEDVKIIKW